MLGGLIVDFKLLVIGWTEFVGLTVGILSHQSSATD